MKRKSQAEMVLDYLKGFGSITWLEAYRDLGVARLSAVIYNLKAQNNDIETIMVTSKNRWGKPIRYARYYLREN